MHVHGFLVGCQEQGYTGTHTHTHTRLWRSGTLAAWTPVHPVVSDTSPDPGHPGQQCQTSQIPRTPWPPVSNLPDHSQTTAVSNLLDSRTPSSVRPPRPLYTQQCQTSPTPVHPAVSDLPDPCIPSSVRPPRSLYTQQCQTSLTTRHTTRLSSPSLWTVLRRLCQLPLKPQ